MLKSTKTSPSPKTNNSLPRRRFLAYFSGLGLSSTLQPGILWAKIEQEKNNKITKEMLTDAEQNALSVACAYQNATDFHLQHHKL